MKLPTPSDSTPPAGGLIQETAPTGGDPLAGLVRRLVWVRIPSPLFEFRPTYQVAVELPDGRRFLKVISSANGDPEDLIRGASPDVWFATFASPEHYQGWRPIE
jgi:hypothetical protein